MAWFDGFPRHQRTRGLFYALGLDKSFSVCLDTSCVWGEFQMDDEEG
jgi:hypothetical protein